ncbi:MAG: tetratricopeptide repeat protein [Myxococcota bacterium]|nr:tetratricopeptide repeat protein [Myxococcota bacterium]
MASPLVWALGAGLALAPVVAVAQFRPPPLSEAQRLSASGDGPRLEGSRLLGRGDKQGAQAQFKKAYDYYAQALKVDPQLLVAAEGLGVVGNALGLHDQVIARLGPLTATHPDSVDLAFNLGVAYYKSRRYEDAVPHLEKARVANDRAHLVAHYYLGQYHLAVGRGDQAEVALGSYLALRPDSVAGSDGDIYALLGRAHLLQRRPAEARAAFQRAQQGAGETPALRVGLAEVLVLEGKRKEAIAELKQVSQKFPQHADAQERLSRLLLEDQRAPEAEQVALQLVKLQDGAQAQLLLADVYLAQKRFPQAEQSARKALAADPRFLTAQVRLGTALQGQGRHDEAVKVLEKAVGDSGGSSYEALAALGSANRRAGRFQKALEVHQKALAMAPNYPPSHLLLGADYFVAGDWDKAIRHYETVLRLVPGDKRATHWLALAFARRGEARAAEPGRLEEASRDLRRAFDLESSGAQSRTLGAALLDLGQHEEALGALLMGSSRPDANWRNQQLLGYAQLAVRKPADALKAFQAAEAAAPDEDTRAELKAAVGLALAAQGDLDAAVDRLSSGRGVKAVAALAADNLPVLLYRRALVRLSRGDAGSAREDLAEADKLGGEHPDRRALAVFARALAEVEEGKDREAAGRLRSARLDRVDWLQPGASGVLTAYLHYRADRLPQGKRAASSAISGGGPAGRFASRLVRAVGRREAQLAYAKGDQRRAEAAFRAALQAEPSSAALAVNLASARYGMRGGKGVKEAVGVWTQHADNVPEALLNLGIHALEKERKVTQAVEYFDRYAKKAAGRSTLAREWAQRLRQLYGEPVVAAEGGAL